MCFITFVSLCSSHVGATCSVTAPMDDVVCW